MSPIVFWILRSALFLVVAIPTCWYAARRGGGPELVVSGLILLGILATTFVPQQTYRQVVEPLLVVDSLVLTGFVVVALTADRYWPLYVAAIQLLTVTLHGVRAYDVTILPDVYARLGGELAYPLIIVLLLGTRRHVRRAPEADWLWQVQHELPHTSGNQHRSDPLG